MARKMTTLATNPSPNPQFPVDLGEPQVHRGIVGKPGLVPDPVFRTNGSVVPFDEGKAKTSVGGFGRGRTDAKSQGKVPKGTGRGASV